MDEVCVWCGEEFAKGLEELINRYSMENGSNTPDFILAGFLVGCLRAFDLATLERDRWHRGGMSGDAAERPGISAVAYRTPACDKHLDRTDDPECPWCKLETRETELDRYRNGRP